MAPVAAERVGLGRLPAIGPIPDAALFACAGRRCGGGVAVLRIAILILALVVPAAVMAQDKQTLADIQADIAALGAEIGGLRQELVASGQAGGAPVAGSALDRMNAIEAALAELTAKTEALELRINRVVQDGTNRLGDLQFRVCELEPGCDVGAIAETPVLGGGTAGGVAPQPTPQPGGNTGGPELAAGEQGDYDRAKGVLDSGDFRGAADLFATFAEAYPGSPLMGEAQYYRGEALMQAGDVAGAARAWLASFTVAKQGPRAGDALLGLGTALGQLGQTAEACVTLGEVPVRFPGSSAAGLAEQERARLGCG